MPPRKSGASTSAPDANGDATIISNATTTSPTQHAHPKQSRQSGGGSGKQDDGVGIDDLLLPRSLVSRLSRGVLPPNTSLQKDALQALTRSATVFISYLAHHANEQSQLRHRKTLGVQDVYAALREIELSGIMDLGAVGTDGRAGGRLEREVALYEEGVMRKRKGYREKVKARESTGAGGDEEERGEPSSKKVRRMSEQEEDEEDRMLERQLNGQTGRDETQQEQGELKETDAGAMSVVVANGHSKGKEKADSLDAQDEDEEAPDEADEAEDDNPADDDERSNLDIDADDDTEDVITDEEPEDDDREVDVTDLEGAWHSGRLGRGLLPNGEVEEISDEESD